MTLRRAWLWPASLVAIFFVAHLPQLPLLAFFNAEEAVNVASALELKRDGHWQLPTLCGQPRREKPPLAAWVTAGMIFDQDRWLAFQARLPALLCATIVLASVYITAKAAFLPSPSGGGPGWGPSGSSTSTDPLQTPTPTLPPEGRAKVIGLLALTFTATNFLFLRHAQLNMADTFLAAACAVAHAGWAVAVFGHHWWRGMIFAGVAMGCAVLAKGHMVFLHVLAPWVVFLIINRRARPTRIPVAPIVAGLILTLLVGGWWYVWVAATNPGIVQFWISEATRAKSIDIHPDRWYAYFGASRFWLPWLPIVLIALPAVLKDRRAMLPAILLLVPFVVMLAFSEKKDRYLLPLIPAAALLSAIACEHLLRARPALMRFAAFAMLVLVLIGHGLYWGSMRYTEKGRPTMFVLGRMVEGIHSTDVITWHPKGFVAVRAAAADLSLEIRRTIRWVDELPTDAPLGTVLFTVRSKKSEPAPLPPDWREMSRTETHNEIRLIYLFQKP